MIKFCLYPDFLLTSCMKGLFLLHSNLLVISYFFFSKLQISPTKVCIFNPDNETTIIVINMSRPVWESDDLTLVFYIMFQPASDWQAISGGINQTLPPCETEQGKSQRLKQGMSRKLGELVCTSATCNKDFTQLHKDRSQKVNEESAKYRLQVIGLMNSDVVSPEQNKLSIRCRCAQL